MELIYNFQSLHQEDVRRTDFGSITRDTSLRESDGQILQRVLVQIFTNVATIGNQPKQTKQARYFHLSFNVMCFVLKRTISFANINFYFHFIFNNLVDNTGAIIGIVIAVLLSSVSSLQLDTFCIRENQELDVLAKCL